MFTSQSSTLQEDKGEETTIEEQTSDQKHRARPEEVRGQQKGCTQSTNQTPGIIRMEIIGLA